MIPHGTVTEDDFFFYSKGKHLWTTNIDFRDSVEDSFRHQIERSDLLQGFTLSADVMSGYGSLTDIVLNEFIKDDCPKAPVVLFALEERNRFAGRIDAGDTSLKYKHDLFELN